MGKDASRVRDREMGRKFVTFGLGFEFPRLLFEDADLEPIDRNVWVAIRMAAMDNDRELLREEGVAVFPSYEELMRRCNVGSKATIARSLSILRSTRWLTLCEPSIYANPRNTVYVLNDEPLPLDVETDLTGQYAIWLEDTAEGKHITHPRAIAVAGRVMARIRAEAEARLAQLNVRNAYLRATLLAEGEKPGPRLVRAK
jgi:hypothetical protein